MVVNHGTSWSRYQTQPTHGFQDTNMPTRRRMCLCTVHRNGTANMRRPSSLIAKHKSSFSDCSLTKSIKVSDRRANWSKLNTLLRSKPWAINDQRSLCFWGINLLLRLAWQEQKFLLGPPASDRQFRKRILHIYLPRRKNIAKTRRHNTK
jgi:hypothetical protein